MRIIGILLFCIWMMCACGKKTQEKVPVYQQKMNPEVKVLYLQTDSLERVNVPKALDVYKQMLALARQKNDNVGQVFAYRYLVF